MSVSNNPLENVEGSMTDQQSQRGGVHTTSVVGEDSAFN